jgi:uncharacterized protein
MKEHRFVRGRKELSVMVHNLSQAAADLPVFIMCHGFTGDKIGANQLHLNVALGLERAGKVVVRFDFAGSGESEGVFAEDTTVIGWLEDLRTIVEWVKGNPEFKGAPIVLSGHSLGGMLVIIYPKDNAITERITLAPVVRPIGNFKVILGPALWEKAAGGETIANFYNKGFELKDGILVKDLIRNDYQPLKAAAELKTPLLIIHGDADCAVPVEGSEELYRIYRGKKQFHRLEGADHVFTGRHTKVHSLIADWLNRERSAE